MSLQGVILIFCYYFSKFSILYYMDVVMFVKLGLVLFIRRK